MIPVIVAILFVAAGCGYAYAGILLKRLSEAYYEIAILPDLGYARTRYLELYYGFWKASYAAYGLGVIFLVLGILQLYA